jgi:hypothetical protein
LATGTGLVLRHEGLDVQRVARLVEQSRRVLGVQGRPRVLLRGELTGIQWLGFALTEAVVFYALLGGLLAYVLV